MQVRVKYGVVVLLSIVVACPACTTMSQVSLNPPSSAAQRELVAGRSAVIHLRSGDDIAGTIVMRDDKSLTVRSRSGVVRGIALEDIESVRTSRFSWGRTAAIIGAVVVGAAGALYLALVHAEKHEE